MSNFEKPDFEERELEKTLTEEEIKKIIKDVKEVILPIYDEIKKIRADNLNTEIGGRIINGEIKLFDKSKCSEDSVIGESYKEERDLAKKGILTFHTHPDDGLTDASGDDILSTYYRFKEIIFHKYGATLLIALKELPIEQIQKIDEKAWYDAEKEDEQWGGQAYWFWKTNIEMNLPVTHVNILDNT